MRHHLRILVSKAGVSAILLALAATPLSLAQVRYELVVPEVYGNVATSTQQRGNEINDNGQTLLNRVATFAVWRDGKATHIVDARTDYPAKLSRVTAASINAYNQVVGSKTYAREGGSGFETVPFYWDPINGLVDLVEIGQQSPVGGVSANLFGINSRGVAIGTSQAELVPSGSGNSAFTWSFETGRVEIPALDEIGNASQTIPAAINDSGTVVGTYHRFAGSPNYYFEAAFVYDSSNGSRSLDQLDPDFFQGSNLTARSINNASLIVGERDQTAYLYDLRSRTGLVLPPLKATRGAMRAYAVNDKGMVAGFSAIGGPSGQSGYAPFVWSRETGSLDLLPQIDSSLRKLLPLGVAPSDCLIIPKSINERGQISAQLNASGDKPFGREVILQPTLDFHWTSMERTVENGVEGVLYRYVKGSEPDSVPLELLGLQIEFLCSSDLSNWRPLTPEDPEIRFSEDTESFELFAPLADCLFIKAQLATER